MDYNEMVLSLMKTVMVDRQYREFMGLFCDRSKNERTLTLPSHTTLEAQRKKEVLLQYGNLREMIEKSLGVKKDHFQSLFRQLDYTLYHIEPVVDEFPEFDKVKKFALESQEDDISIWFEEVKEYNRVLQEVYR